MARIVDENFEGTGYEESWSETVTAGNTLNEDAAIPGTPPTGAGSQCLNAILTPGATNAFATQIKSATNINYLRVYLYISQEGLNNTQTITLFNLRNSSDSATAGIQLIQISGVVGIRYVYYSNGAYQVTAPVTGSLNTWYRIELQYDVTNMLWEWKIDGISQANGSLTGAVLTPDRLSIGGNHNGAGTSNIYLDLVAWDNTDWVEAVEAVEVKNAGYVRIKKDMKYRLQQDDEDIMAVMMAFLHTRY